MLLRRYHKVSSQPVKKVEKPVEKAETKKPVTRKRVVKNG